jgi:sugar (pentulose or hexulose) kinase
MSATVGLDVGSTYVKGVLVDQGAEIGTARRPTPWQSLPHGRSEMAASALFAAVEEVLAELGASGTQVVGIGVSGMAEAGALLDADDQVTCAVVAWFDPRGDEDVADMPADLRAEFAGRTGLPLSSLASFTKLWHRNRHEGLQLSERQWLNVPELVTWWLGGARLAEVSLAARTGLLDQDTGQVWPKAVEALGVTTDLVPPLTPAGSVWGTATRHVPVSMDGAVLTVAGHDHLVSSAASGVLDVDTLYDSMGTAEAVVRMLDGVLDRGARERLAAHNVNVVRHMLPGYGVMLAGTRSGLLMRRALQLVGVNDAAGRERIDAEVMALPADRTDLGICVVGADNSDGVLAIRADADGLSPALLVEATLRHGADVLAGVIAHMDAENPPASRSVVAGGWAKMRSVRRSRASVLPLPRYSDLDEDTAYGAALVAAFAAAFAADDSAEDLVTFLVARLARPVAGTPAGLTPHPTPGGTPR